VRLWKHILWILPVAVLAGAGATLIEAHHLEAQQRAADIENAKPPPQLVANHVDLEALDEAVACAPISAADRRHRQLEIASLTWAIWLARAVRDPDRHYLEESRANDVAIAASETDEAQRQGCTAATAAAQAAYMRANPLPYIVRPPTPLAEASLPAMKEERDYADRQAMLDQARREGFAAGQSAQEGMDESRAAEAVERANSVLPP